MPEHDEWSEGVTRTDNEDLDICYYQLSSSSSISWKVSPTFSQLYFCSQFLEVNFGQVEVVPHARNRTKRNVLVYYCAKMQLVFTCIFAHNTCDLVTKMRKNVTRTRCVWIVLKLFFLLIQ